MFSGRNGQGRPAFRVVLAVCSTVAAFFATAAVASAATYFVDEAGNDVGTCTSSASPCETIQYAIDQHRLAPQPDDVIRVAAGTYEQYFRTGGAGGAADEGLTITGELDSGGFQETVVNGSGPDPGCNCVVNLASGAAVTLKNIEVGQDGSDLGSTLTPVRVSSNSRLTTVDVPQLRETAIAGILVGCVSSPAPVIEDSLIDVSDEAAQGIEFCNRVTVEDSTVISGVRAAIQAGGVGGTLALTRSFAGTEENFDPVVSSSNLTLDSSVVAGGNTGVDITGTASTVDINNSTIDTDVPGDEDSDPGVLLRPTGTVDLDVDSSILLEDIVAIDGTGTVTCGYTNFLGFDDTTGPPAGYTDECPVAGAPGSTNTDLFPQQMFVGPDPFLPLGFDYALISGSPAVDGGRPGPVPPGFSTTDFYEDPRIQVGRSANCPTGIRDQGAIERAAVNCNRTLSVSTTGTGLGTITGPGINCGAGNTDCSESYPPGTAVELNATAADGSEFQGFSGSGCSASPCTVTMDAGKSVQASFRDTRADTRTLTVELTGVGGGVVTGPGINCGTGDGQTDCSQSYAAGERIELSADPNKDSIFGRFTGSGCDASPCTMTMDISRSVVGRFDDARIPKTTFARKPKKAERNPVFRMRSSQPVPTFECKVDKGDWEGCEKRVELRGLDAGRHTFRARSTNKFGVTGPPAKARFRVKR